MRTLSQVKKANEKYQRQGTAIRAWTEVQQTKKDKMDTQRLVAARADAKAKKMVHAISGVGYIEEVFGTYTSFNVFKRFYAMGRAEFYKSAYSLETAKQYLRELDKKSQKHE